MVAMSYFLCLYDGLPCGSQKDPLAFHTTSYFYHPFLPFFLYIAYPEQTEHFLTYSFRSSMGITSIWPDRGDTNTATATLLI